MNKPIYSTDKSALEQLRAKLETLEKRHEEMKAQNQYFRAHCTMRGYPDMTDDKAASIDQRIEKDYSWNKAPFPSWQLQNSNQEINRIKMRIKTLEREQEYRSSDKAGEYDTDGLGFDVVENTDIERLQIIYDGNGRVDNATYRSLKSRGFVFSRTNQAFQRQLNDNARWAARNFISEQQRLQKERTAEAEM